MMLSSRAFVLEHVSLLGASKVDVRIVRVLAQLCGPRVPSLFSVYCRYAIARLCCVPRVSYEVGGLRKAGRKVVSAEVLPARQYVFQREGSPC